MILRIQDNHRPEPQARKCDACKLHLAEEISERQFLFFSSFYFFFPLARETPGVCIYPGFIAQSSYQECLLLLQPNFWWQMWRQASQLCVSVPECRPANPLPSLCCVLSQPRALCSLGRTLVIGHRGFEPPPTQKSVCGSYPTHTTNIPGVASAASGGSVSESIGTTRLWAFLYFSRRTKKAWTMFVLYLSSLICGFCWLSEHLAPLLCCEDYQSKTNKLWNINSTCLQAGSFLSADDLVRDPQFKNWVLMGLNKLQHFLVVGKNIILWLCKWEKLTILRELVI